MTLLHIVAVILIALTVFIVGIVPLLAVFMKDDDGNKADWKEITQKIRRTN